MATWSLHEYLNHVPQAAPSIVALQVAAAFVLLIACANLVVPRAWVEKISRAVTLGRDVNPRFFGSGQVGYGYLWWIREDGGALAGAYEGRGAFGQFIAVIPQLDMVIAH